MSRRGLLLFLALGIVWGIPYALITVVSSTIIAGVGSWALTGALAPTGVLDRFAAGRDRALV